MSLAIDLSNNNGAGFDFASFKKAHPHLVAVQAKASEGKTFSDPDFSTFFNRATKEGLVVNPYHYARPDVDKGIVGGVAEADKLISEIKPYLGHKLLGRPVMDYESVQALDFAEAFCKRIRNKLGVWPIIYCSGSRVEEIDRRPLLKSLELWVAVYGASFQQYVGPHSGTVVQWQFTDNYENLGIDASHVFVPADHLLMHRPKPVVIEQVVVGGRVVRQVVTGGGRVTRLLRSPLVRRLVKAGRVVFRRKHALR